MALQLRFFDDRRARGQAGTTDQMKEKSLIIHAALANTSIRCRLMSSGNTRVEYGSGDRETFAALLDSLRDFEATRPAKADAPIPPQQFVAFLDQFTQEWTQQLEAHSDQPPSLNIWRAAGLGRNEVRNCHVLHWLLDPSETHCQGRRFLRCLLRAMGQPVDIANDQSLRVKRENTTSYGDSRIDLLIESRRYVICIEAKIDAADDEQQLTRYYQQLGDIARAQNRIFVGRLLSPRGVSGDLVVGGFHRLLWSDVASALWAFAAWPGESDFSARNAFVRDVARQYADFVVRL